MEEVIDKKAARISVGEWQDRIIKTFAVNGVVGATHIILREHERAYTAHITETYRGHDFIMGAFFDFYTETLQAYSKFLRTQGWPKDLPWYSIFLAKFFSIYRSFKAADKLFYAGYGLDAYSLLRDVKDRVFNLALVANKYTTLEAIEGLYAGSIRNHKEYKKKKDIIKNERSKALKLFCGTDSGLSIATQEELEFWRDLFHMQVHGASFSDVELLGNLQNGLLPLLSAPSEVNIALYMNRSQEIAWMIVRLLPLLKFEAVEINDDWRNKYHVLDDSFRYSIEGLASIGKKISHAIIELIDSKFAFPPESSSYFE